MDFNNENTCCESVRLSANQWKILRMVRSATSVHNLKCWMACKNSNTFDRAFLKCISMGLVELFEMRGAPFIRLTEKGKQLIARRKSFNVSDDEIRFTKDEIEERKAVVWWLSNSCRHEGDKFGEAAKRQFDEIIIERGERFNTALREYANYRSEYSPIGLKREKKDTYRSFIQVRKRFRYLNDI